MRLVLISAALPPQIDGIGDYTACLAAQLAGEHEVTILTDRDSAPTPIPGVVIEGCFSPQERSSTRAILPSVRRVRPDWVVLQYNPFAFGGRGFNAHLPLVMRSMRRRAPRTRLAIMCHEVFTPFINARFAVMTTWQRAQLYVLGKSADSLFFSTEAWAQRFASWFRTTPVAHLPVGSSITPVKLDPCTARVRLGVADEQVVLGLFGTAHPSRMLDLAANAARGLLSTGHDAVVLYVGPDAPLVRPTFAGIRLHATNGPVSAGEVSRRFRAMDLYLAPFVDGVSTRRSSFMTGLQHGVPTVGTSGTSTDSMIEQVDGDALLLAPVERPSQFLHEVHRLVQDAGLRRTVGERGRAFYEREFDWPRIAERLTNALDRTSSTRVDDDQAA